MNIEEHLNSTLSVGKAILTEEQAGYNKPHRKRFIRKEKRNQRKTSAVVTLVLTPIFIFHLKFEHMNMQTEKQGRDILPGNCIDL